MKLFANRRKSIESNQLRAAWLFLLPWLIGVVYFFIIPFAKTFLYSFNTVGVSRKTTGLEYAFVGLRNFNYILFQDASFNHVVVDAVSSLLYTVPVILLFSLFVALLLNQKFRGRIFMRALFFLPVIIASGVVIHIFKENVFASASSTANTAIFQTNAVQEILVQIGLPNSVISMLTGVSSRVFDLTWKSGIQILLFISALQSIPPSYYEAAAIEGSDSWNAFWKITFPVLSPTSFLVAIYTIIDSFTDVDNPVMVQMLQRIDDLKYGIAAASSILYFLVVLVVIGLVSLLFSRRVFYNG